MIFSKNYLFNSPQLSVIDYMLPVYFHVAHYAKPGSPLCITIINVVIIDITVFI
jgi:hypothetical protein